MRKLVFFLVFSFCFLSFVFAFPSLALRQRVRKSQKNLSSQTSSSFRGIRANIRFRPDRQGLLMSFSGFDNVESVSYELVYDANGISQGVGGVISIGDTETKSLFFGTCSSGICTSHNNITNARLSIRTTLKNGTLIFKPYRIRV